MCSRQKKSKCRGTCKWTVGVGCRKIKSKPRRRVVYDEYDDYDLPFYQEPWNPAPDQQALRNAAAQQALRNAAQQSQRNAMDEQRARQQRNKFAGSNVHKAEENQRRVIRLGMVQGSRLYINRSTDCPVCYETYDMGVHYPIVGRCGHKQCRDCLRRSFAAGIPGRCPFCGVNDTFDAV